MEYISRCVKVELVPSNGRKLEQRGTLNRLNLEYIVSFNGRKLDQLGSFDGFKLEQMRTFNAGKK